MHALPFVLATVAAMALAAPLLRALSEGGHVKANYRERDVVFPFGVLSVVARSSRLRRWRCLQQLEVADVFYPGVG